MSSIDTDINIYVQKFGKIKRKRERETSIFLLLGAVEGLEGVGGTDWCSGL